MPHIPVNSDEPGIRGLLSFRPETARPLSQFLEVLVRGPSTLTRGERELIGTYVSSLNGCKVAAQTETICSLGGYNPPNYISSPQVSCRSGCQGQAHSAYAAAQIPEGMELVRHVCADAENAPVTDKLRALLAIASAVRESGPDVTDEHVAAARAAGATDLEIHDCVLIAATFCMLNRYVDGLATIAPEDPAAYAARARRIVEDGYIGVVEQLQPNR